MGSPETGSTHRAATRSGRSGAGRRSRHGSPACVPPRALRLPGPTTTAQSPGGRLGGFDSGSGAVGAGAAPSGPGCLGQYSVGTL
jgi:hypothetical protein